MDQLKLIIKVLGPPSDDDLSFINSSKARAYIRALPQQEVSRAVAAGAIAFVGAERVVQPQQMPQICGGNHGAEPPVHLMQTEQQAVFVARAAILLTLAYPTSQPCGCRDLMVLTIVLTCCWLFDGVLPHSSTLLQRVPWSEKFPDADPQALDLMDKMLQFHPGKRIDVAAALKHPWLAQLHDETQEPAAPGVKGAGRLVC